MQKVSIGIMAYNEEANIGRLLEAVLNQKLIYGYLNEIIVVASGSALDMGQFGHGKPE